MIALPPPTSSDTLMKAIFDVFGRIFAHLDGYNGDFLPEFDLRVLPRCKTDL